MKEKNNRSGNVRKSVVVALFVAVLVSGFCVHADENRLKAHFIDVGQGDSAFLELPDGKTMLIDAGTDEYGETVAEYIKALD